MQLTNSDEKEKIQKKVDKNILDLLWKLTNNKSKSRIDACADILCILQRKQDETENEAETTKDLQYCLERLVKGLASPRDSARLGFSLLLTQILKHMDIVLIEDILELVKQHLSLTSNMDKKDAIFGQLFAYSSIVRSGKLADHSHLSYVVLALHDLWFGKSYIQNAAYEILLNLFSQLSEERFCKNVWPHLKKKLTFGWEKFSADSAWPLFLCIRMFPDTVAGKFLKKNWGADDIFSSDNTDQIKKAIRQTTACLPVLHPLCIEVLNICLIRKDGKAIWNALIDDNLFETDQTEKAYVGFELVKKALHTAQKKKIIKYVLSPKFCTTFTKSLLNSKHPMNPAATCLGNFLCDFVKQTKDPDIQIIILKVFLLHSVPIDQIIKKKEVSVVIQNLLPDAVKSFCELLKSMAISKNDEDEDGVHNKRFQAVLQIGSLVCHPAVISEIEWRLSVIKFLFLHSFFNLVTPTQDILHCETDCTDILPNLRESFRNSFYKALNSLYHRTDQHITPLDQFLQHLLSLTDYAEQLMAASEFVSSRFPLERVQESWQQMKSIVNKLNKQSKKDGKTNESNVFQALFLELGFHLFRDPDHISEVLEELHICCKKALHQRKHAEEGDDEPSWVSVVVDILLSLLSRSSQHLRCIVMTVFPLLCPFITEEALQPILDVINPTKAGDEPMLVDEDENESDVHFDSGSSSDESDSNEPDAAKVDEKFRQKVKEALGPAAEESDAESVVLSDSEMFKLDDAIAKAFQGRLQSGHTQLSFEDKTMLHFRVRCLDLIMSYIKSDPPMHMVLQCIQPVMAAYEYGHKGKHQSQLLHKAVSTLQILTRIKKFQHLDNVKKSELKEHLETLVSKCHKETDMAVAKKLYSLCVFMVLCFRRLEAHKSPEKQSKKHSTYMKVYLSALETFVKGSSSHIFPQFFVSLMESCPDLAWNFIEPCQHYAFDTDIRIYKRTQCLGLIFEAIKFSKGQSSVTAEQWLEIGNSLIPAAVQSLKNVLSNPEVKPVHLTELLDVIFTTNCILKEKANKSVLDNHKDLLPLLSEMTKDQLKKLMKKGSAVRRKIILALGGSIPSNKKVKVVSLDNGENSGDDELQDTEPSANTQLSQSDPSISELDGEEQNSAGQTNPHLNILEASPSGAESKKRKSLLKKDKQKKKRKSDSAVDVNNSSLS